jgi:hypothetical protein
MRFLTIGLFLIFWTVTKPALTQTASGEWPQFLGPTRDGKSSDTQLVQVI